MTPERVAWSDIVPGDLEMNCDLVIASVSRRDGLAVTCSFVFPRAFGTRAGAIGLPADETTLLAARARGARR